MGFRLEKLLSLKIKEEEVIKHALVSIRLKISELEDEIERSEAYRNEIEQELRIGSVPGAQLSFLLYIKKLQERYIEFLKNKLSGLRSQEEKILAQYLEKRAERKSLEKLKERYVQRELLQMDRKERILIDEIALQRFVRRGERMG
uniref:Flagellar FliJ protein n=1 Tax=Fervidobacterium thailandense TaxID=1008305 RepID=A0A7C4VTU8_9BACT